MVLRSKSGFEELVSFPSTSDIPEIPSLLRSADQAGAFRKGIDSRLVQALARGAGAGAQSSVKSARNATYCVLHA
ncbi:MAG TPA: hypothetical protein VEZ11_13000 [Thermoanaerobaculia bacterium]|nr:hypothetical protein [Thermoanaerobaculia bacterium]